MYQEGAPTPSTHVTSSPTAKKAPKKNSVTGSEASPIASTAAAPSPAAIEAVSANVSTGSEGLSQGKPAALDRRSFPQPEYTRAARLAQYETSVVADIFVKQDGTVGEVKFDQPLLYDMEPRLLQAIRAARFSPAQNSAGQLVSTWTRVRFKLVIPR